MKSALARGPLRGLASGGVGYFLAIAGKSVPEQLLKKPAVARVVSHGSALKLGKDGRPEGAATGPGAILYEGPLRIASAATIPYYGYRFKLFPYAGKRRSMMQLRLSDMSVPSILVSLPKIWDGKFSHPNLYDFLAEDVTLEFDREMPLQVAGDAAGYHKSVRIGMAPRSVELIDFSSRRS